MCSESQPLTVRCFIWNQVWIRILSDEMLFNASSRHQSDCCIISLHTLMHYCSCKWVKAKTFHSHLKRINNNIRLCMWLVSRFIVNESNFYFLGTKCFDWSERRLFVRESSGNKSEKKGFKGKQVTDACVYCFIGKQTNAWGCRIHSQVKTSRRRPSPPFAPSTCWCCTPFVYVPGCSFHPQSMQRKRTGSDSRSSCWRCPRDSPEKCLHLLPGSLHPLNHRPSVCLCFSEWERKEKKQRVSEGFMFVSLHASCKRLLMQAIGQRMHYDS